MVNNLLRISRVHNDYGNNDEWLRGRRDLVAVLKKSRYDIRDGSQDRNIELFGTYGVQSHMRDPYAFIFYGKGTTGESLKLLSAIVGTQVLDDYLHFGHAEDEFRKPIITYGNPKYYALTTEQMEVLKIEGTVRQDIIGPNALVKHAVDPNSVIEILASPVRKMSSVHGGHVDFDSIKQYEVGTHLGTNLEEPNFKVCVFTSATMHQDDESISEAYKLGRLIAEGGTGLISGLGSTGLMGEVHKGCVENGGWSAGSNCPHIIKWEGLPFGFSQAWVVPDIYQRMAIMIEKSDVVVIGGGGRGGAGTFQELMACIHSIDQGAHSRIMRAKDGRNFKPIIFDQRKELWGPAIELCKHFGLQEGKHFHIAHGSEQVMELVERHKNKQLPTASIYEPLAARNIRQAGLVI